MTLSSYEALQIVQSPPNRQKVKKGELYQSRLRILTEAFDYDSIQKQTAWQELDRHLRTRLTDAKYNAVVKYWTFPLDVVNITNDMLTDLFYVFHGRNAAFEVQYPNTRLKETSEAMLSTLSVKDWIYEHGKKVLKCEPNSVAIVDLNDNGEPVLIYVCNDDIYGYELNEDGAFEFIVFEHSEGKDSAGEWEKIGLYDSEFYRVYLKRSDNYTLLIEAPHNLGYCPCTFFYDKPLTDADHFDRSIPFTNTMGVLTKWQIIDLFLDYAEDYGTFPAIEYADSGCDVPTCEGGIIAGHNVLNDSGVVVAYVEPKQCPSCAKKGLIGPGTAIGIEVSQDADVQDTRGILRFVTPEVTSLEYVSKKQTEKEVFIKLNTVGYAQSINGQPVNELQIRSLLESRRKPLLEIKYYLEKLYRFLVKTSIKLISDVDVEVSADYGTEYFILTETDIMKLIQEAKLAGVQSSEVAELNRMLIDTKYKNDPFKAQKLKIAADLEPSPFDTREEIKSKFLDGMISREDYFLKLNFTDLLGRFERENGSVVNFGIELPYSIKIDRIKNTLLYYIKQMMPNDTSEQVQDSGEGTSDNTATTRV